MSNDGATITFTYDELEIVADAVKDLYYYNPDPGPIDSAYDKLLAAVEDLNNE